MPGIVASRNYSPGDVIFSEEPFVKVLARDFKNILCESCRQRPFILRACKSCLAVKYCDKICQKKDWSDHKLECAHLQKLPENNHLTDLVRILARTIFKLKGKNWKDIKKRILGTDYTFDDIHSHYKLMTENRRLNLLCKETKELLTTYIGKENMTGDVDFIKILGKVQSNLYFIEEVKGKIFYMGMCAFDMECIPNSNVCCLSADRVELRANRKIKKGVDRISFRFKKVFALTYATTVDPTSLLNEPCQCVDCSLPYGESVLSKILDESRAYSVICETEAFLNLMARLPEVEFSPLLRMKMEALLRRQEGVLGKSNILRLRLLALRCLKFGGHPLAVGNLLLELEQTMREVFGERYLELVPIYVALSQLNMEVGNFWEGNRFLNKALNILPNLSIREQMI